MKIAPLIHSRTLYCDYNPNLSVRPKNIDVQWAKKKILLSTNNIENLNDIRRIVACKDGVCIAGVGCKLSQFIQKFIPEVAEQAKKYFKDEDGRYIQVFLGYAFEIKENSIPDVSDLDLWKMFEKYFTPEWERKFFETVPATYDYEVGEKNLLQEIQPPVEEISDISFYIADETLNDKLFDYCLTEKKDFCSNADQMKIIDSGEFKIISTSQNLIDRFKTKTEKKTQPLQQITIPQVQKTVLPTQSNKSIQSKEKLKEILAICAIVLIIICVIYLM